MDKSDRATAALDSSLRAGCCMRAEACLMRVSRKTQRKAV